MLSLMFPRSLFRECVDGRLAAELRPPPPPERFPTRFRATDGARLHLRGLGLTQPRRERLMDKHPLGSKTGIARKCVWRPGFPLNIDQKWFTSPTSKLQNPHRKDLLFGGVTFKYPGVDGCTGPYQRTRSRDVLLAKHRWHWQVSRTKPSAAQ